MRRRDWGLAVSTILLVIASTHSASVATAQNAPAPTSGRVYSSAEVDSHALVIDDGTRPTYPEALRPLGIDGKVLAQFVVDTTGRVDTTSIMFAENAQPLFAASVRQVLGVMHFRAASKAGKKVAEEVEESFVFKNDEPRPLNVDSVLRAMQKRLDIGPAVPKQGSITPRYPDKERSAGFSGEVDVQFVIDTTGKADMKTVQITSTRSWRTTSPAIARPDPTNPGPFPVTDVDARQAFVRAVMIALPGMEFIPARRDGQNIRQLVKQPFTFTITAW